MNPQDPFNPAQLPVPLKATAIRTARAVPTPMAQADEGGPSFSFQIILKALTRHWWQILAIWGTLSLISIYAIQRYVFPNYRAFGIIQVEPSPVSPFQMGFHAAENFEGYLETQVNLLTNPNVLDAVSQVEEISHIPRIQTAIDPVDELSRIVRANIRPKTQLIEISATTKSIQDSAKIVDEVINKYLEFVKTKEAEIDKKQLDNLERFRKDIVAEVVKIQADIVALADLGVAIPAAPEKGAENTRPSINELSQQEYRNYNNQLFDTKIELAAVESELANRKELQSATVTDSAERRNALIRHYFDKDPDVRRIREEMSKAKARLVNSGSRSTGDPAHRQIRQQIYALELQHTEHWQEKYPVLAAQVEADLAGDGSDDSDLQELESKVGSLKAREASIEQSLARIKVAKQADASNTVKMDFLSEDLRVKRVMQESLDRRIQDMAFSSTGEARITKISGARSTGAPVSDYRLKLMAGTPMGLILLIAGFFMVLEIRAGRVETPEDLVSRSKVEILGVLPPLPTQSQRSIGFMGRREDRMAAFVQSLDHLRVSLCSESGQGGRCVVITSAVGGEGKTTLSVQLAARFAHAGVSTVLIDADLRRASLSKLLGASESVGLRDVLQGDLDVESALTVCGQAGGFHLLSAGTPGIDPGRLLQGRNVEQLLAHLRQTFDVIIIDTPPVLPVPDALTLGRWADGCILAVRRDASRFPLVEQANRRLVGAGIAVLGAVVNGVPSVHSGYGNGSYTYASTTSPDNQVA